MTPVYIFEEMRLPMELLAAALLYLVPFAKKRMHFWLRAVLGYVVLTAASLLFFVIFLDKDNPRWGALSAFWYSLIALSAIPYARFCFDISRQDAFFFDISAFLTQNIVYSLYHCFLARELFPILREWLAVYILGAILVSAAVYAPIYFIFRGALRRADGELLPKTSSVYGSLIGFFVAMMVCLFFYQGVFDQRVSTYDALAWLSGILVCIFMLVIQYNILTVLVQVREKSNLENMLLQSERYYELTKEQIAIINRKAHDLKHQLRALEQASDAERTEYIRETENSVDFYRLLVYTDNEALNTILAEKGLLCREKGIEFRCAAESADFAGIRLSDLYALLGNAIDNAIEYVDALRDPLQKTINLRITERNGFLGIQVANPYLGEALDSNTLPKTSKAHPENHGFGLKSIRYLAQKYGGSMEFSTADHLFTLQILLPTAK